jgi:hypothetical protein
MTHDRTIARYGSIIQGSPPGICALAYILRNRCDLEITVSAQQLDERIWLDGFSLS